ncbi:MAG: ATP-binding protein [Myxococcota bacterium]
MRQLPYKRYLVDAIWGDLREGKMAFVGGPRLVGKTTLALGFLREGNHRPAAEDHPAYLNWDAQPAKAALLRGELPPRQPLLVLDEIHKFARWRNLVKGLHDTHKSKVRFIVTGSARLDYYRRGGDSLLGRYHYFRLHPFSLREMTSEPSREDVESLLRFGGFPEPLARQSETAWRRWQRERLQRVLREDLRDLERVREVSLIELLMDSLPERVGSPLSVRSLSDHLQVAHESVERWLSILERLYLCFRILPFGAAKIRAVKKEKKLYFWDWSANPNPGARFENLVASQLLKYCHFREDTLGHSMELRFIRDTDKREIDFVVLEDKRPVFAVECKNGETAPSPAAYYFRERTKIPRFYQVHLGTKDYGNEETAVRVLPFGQFCQESLMP